ETDLTPANRARTWRPTPRRSPKPSSLGGRELQHTRRGGGGKGLAQRGPQPAGRAEARHTRGGDADAAAGARIGAVARGAPGDDEGAEPADGRAAAVAQAVADAGQERVQRALGGGLRAAGGGGE